MGVKQSNVSIQAPDGAKIAGLRDGFAEIGDLKFAALLFVCTGMLFARICHLGRASEHGCWFRAETKRSSAVAFFCHRYRGFAAAGCFAGGFASCVAKRECFQQTHKVEIVLAVLVLLYVVCIAQGIIQQVQQPAMATKKYRNGRVYRARSLSRTSPGKLKSFASSILSMNYGVVYQNFTHSLDLLRSSLVVNVSKNETARSGHPERAVFIEAHWPHYLFTYCFPASTSILIMSCIMRNVSYNCTSFRLSFIQLSLRAMREVSL